VVLLGLKRTVDRAPTELQAELRTVQEAVRACLDEVRHAAMRGEPFRYPGAITALIRAYLERDRQGRRIPETILTPCEEVVKPRDRLELSYAIRTVSWNRDSVPMWTRTGTPPFSSGVFHHTKARAKRHRPSTDPEEK
jgi:hypothetical protein